MTFKALFVYFKLGLNTQSINHRSHIFQKQSKFQSLCVHLPILKIPLAYISCKHVLIVLFFYVLYQSKTLKGQIFLNLARDIFICAIQSFNQGRDTVLLV